MTDVLLFDVEGTTTAIDFVHKTLFPYSRERMEGFVRANPALPVVQDLVRDHGTLERVIAVLLDWIAADKKEGRLKELQGLIWDEGYRKGHFQGQVYSDVRPAFERWKREGKTLAIYSSGSVHAQKCIFGFSSAGDLTPFLSAYFDTAVGGKREADSYLRIAQQLNVSPTAVTFFSDIKEELDAARAAGMATRHVFRSGPPTSQGHETITAF